jgi:hypothetical protein
VRAGASGRLGDEVAAVDRDALAHPEQIPLVARLRVADVGHLERDLGVAVPEPNRGVARIRCLERPFERLLDHPVGREVDARGERGLLALDLELDRQAGRPCARDEVADVGERGLRSQRQLLVVAAQHAEQVPDLGERLAAGRLDRREGALGHVGLLAHEPFGGAGLADHRRDRRADHVVELPGDPRALLCDGGAGARGAVALDGERLLVQRPVQPYAGAYEPAEQQRAAGDDRQREEPVVDAAGRLVEADGDDRAPSRTALAAASRRPSAWAPIE